MQIGIIVKPGSESALAALREVVQAVAIIEPEAKIFVEADGVGAVRQAPAHVARIAGADFAERMDLAIALGGDGTLIHAASLFPAREVPILGVNLGTIGFMTETTRENLSEGVAGAISGALPSSLRMRLDVRVWRGDRVVLERRILNDTVLANAALSRMGTYRVSAGGQFVTAVRGDGVIVATPTGSTAYNMAAGGPILVPELEVVAVTPICSHQLTQRPIVLRPDREIEIELVGEQPVFATCDGQAGHEFRPTDRLVVCRATVGTRLFLSPTTTYFEMLRTKLRWGDG